MVRKIARFTVAAFFCVSLAACSDSNNTTNAVSPHDKTNAQSDDGMKKDSAGHADEPVGGVRQDSLPH